MKTLTAILNGTVRTTKAYLVKIRAVFLVKEIWPSLLYFAMIIFATR